MINRSPFGEPFRLAWDSFGRIYVEWTDRKGQQNGELTDVTMEFWAVVRRVIQERGIYHMNLKASIDKADPKSLVIVETHKSTRLKQSFRITVEEIALEEDEL